MIFLTVGSQMPFDRLVAAVDAWAARNDGNEVYAQIGDTHFKPKVIQFVRSLTPVQFVEKVMTSQLVVAHAGMGSILTALEHAKPLVLLPRRFDLKETRNDHQIATAKWLGQRAGIFAAESEADIGRLIELALDTASTVAPLASSASSQLIERIARFIERA